MHFESYLFVYDIGSPTPDNEWPSVASNEIEEPKYAVLNNDDLKMMREEFFNKKAKQINELEELSESFKTMNVSDHPAVKKLKADRQKQFEEEHAKDLEGGPEDEHQPINTMAGVPEDMLKDNLGEPASREGGMNLQDSVMDYISKNILTEEKEGEEDEDDDLDWKNDAQEKEEL